jgi:hypothetical protein
MLEKGATPEEALARLAKVQEDAAKVAELEKSGEIGNSTFHGSNSDILPGLEQTGGELRNAKQLEADGLLPKTGEGDAFSGRAGPKDFISVGQGESGFGTSLAYADANTVLTHYNPQLYKYEELSSEVDRLRRIVSNYDTSIGGFVGAPKETFAARLKALEDELNLRNALPKDSPRYIGGAGNETNFPMLFEFDGAGLTTKVRPDVSPGGMLGGEASVYDGINLPGRITRVYVPEANRAEAIAQLEKIFGHGNFEVLSIEGAKAGLKTSGEAASSLDATGQGLKGLQDMFAFKMQMYDAAAKTQIASEVATKLGVDAGRVGPLLDKVGGAAEIEALAGRVGGFDKLEHLLGGVSSGKQLASLLDKTESVAELEGLASRVGGIDKLEGLMGKVSDGKQLSGLLDQVGDAGTLQRLLGKTDAATIDQLLKAGGDPKQILEGLEGGKSPEELLNGLKKPTGPLTMEQRFESIQSSGLVTGDLTKLLEEAKAGDPGAIGELEAMERWVKEGKKVVKNEELQNVKNADGSPRKNPDYTVDGSTVEIKTRNDSLAGDDRYVKSQIDSANKQIKKSGDAPDPGALEIQLRGEAADTADAAAIERQVNGQFKPDRSRNLNRVTIYRNGEKFMEWIRNADGSVTRVL